MEMPLHALDGVSVESFARLFHAAFKIDGAHVLVSSQEAGPRGTGGRTALARLPAVSRGQRQTIRGTRALGPWRETEHTAPRQTKQVFELFSPGVVHRTILPRHEWL